LAETTGADVGDLLIDGGHLTEAQWVQALSRRFDLPIAQVDIDAPDKTAIAQVGETLARKHQVLPFRVADDRVYVATSNPLDREMLDELIGSTEHLGLMVAGRRSIIRNIDREYDALASAEAAIVAFGLVDAEADQQAGITRATVDENAPVVQVVNRIVTQGVRNRASDVHIEALEDSVRVRYRIDGALSEAIRLPQRMASPIASRVKVLAELNIVERRRPQDGQFSLDVDGRPIDIRVSVVSTIHGEKVVMRLLDKAQNLISLDRLGMPSGLIDDYIKIVSAPVGMFLCTGPTGSGKTTTLYATLTEIQDDSKNVVTIEDPVEYEFRGINQMQVHEAGGFTFAEGLRGTLRQDPDVILVGEIRNAETAQIAMQAALTGHLVLSSLHAVDAVAAVHRFIDMGIEPFLVASAINGVMGATASASDLFELPHRLRTGGKPPGDGADVGGCRTRRVVSRGRLQCLQPHRISRSSRRIRIADVDRRDPQSHRGAGHPFCD
jgi:type IV pilus assembly protein PilB